MFLQFFLYKFEIILKLHIKCHLKWTSFTSGTSILTFGYLSLKIIPVLILLFYFLKLAGKKAFSLNKC